MIQRGHLAGYKVFFSLLAISAIVTELATLVERGQLQAANFFSYFTIESNLFAAVILLLSAFAVMRGRQSARLGLLRGAAALYMTITGLVFALLLSGLENVEFTAVPWDNMVLHYIMPVVLFVDWLIDRPAKVMPFKQAMLWILFPVLYGVYSLVRGQATGWYPYPFLDVGQKGMVSVVVSMLLVAGVTLGLTWLLVRIARPRRTAK